MGSAFIALLAKDYHITVVSPNTKPKIDIPYFPILSEVKTAFDFIIFAVKPWILPEVMPLFSKHHYHNDTIFVSVITGASLSFFHQNIGEHAKIVRVMPNLPSQVGKGILAVFPNINVEFLDKLGRVIYVKEELDINKFTSFTGSGSGFVFSILEMYQKAQKKLNIATEFDEREVILDLFEGAIELLKHSKLPFAEQKSKVVVQKGTTFEGLKALDQCEPLFEESLVRAYNRANEIGEETMAKLNQK